MKGIVFAAKTLKKNIISDVSALGGLPIYSLLILYFLIQDISIATKLIYSLIIILLIVYSIKLIYFKKRPDISKNTFSSLLEKLESSSFPSLHAGRTAILFLAFFYQSSLTMMLLGLSIFVLIIISRVLLKRHYISDVIVGSLLGLAIGYIVFVM